MKSQEQDQKQLTTTSKSSLPQQISWNPQDKAQLASVIGKVFDLQKQFGKTTTQLENIIDGFCWALQDYPLSEIIRGFGVYIKRNSDMPTPSDIVAIIDPIKQPWKPDKAYYISLKDIHKTQGPYGLNDDEIEYIQAYEAYMKNERRNV